MNEAGPADAGPGKASAQDESYEHLASAVVDAEGFAGAVGFGA